jgi:hypothetical protein
MHGVMDLLAAYRCEGGRIDGVTSIDCGVLSAGMSLVGEPLSLKRKVTGMVDAQFSMPFGAALALSRGESSVRDFERAGEIARGLQPLKNLTQVHTSQRLDAAYPSQWGAEVTLRFAEIVSLVETARGIENVQLLCAAPGVVRLAFGCVDLATQLGVAHDDPVALDHVRARLVLASAAAGLAAPIDGITTNLLDDSATPRRRAARAAAGLSRRALRGSPPGRDRAICLGSHPRRTGLGSPRRCGCGYLRRGNRRPDGGQGRREPCPRAAQD